MMIALFFTNNRKQVNLISLSGSLLLLLSAIALVVLFWRERTAGNTAQMLFAADTVWYREFNIHIATGVDGISVLMVLLSAIIVFTASLVSWRIESMPKEFYTWFSFLAAGAFGFFISIDLFTMFFFLEMSVVPKFLLIGVWGSGRKDYSAMKLVLMLMGGSVLVLTGILGIYYLTGAETLNIVELAHKNIEQPAQSILFALLFTGFGIIGALFPFHVWVPDGHSSAPTSVSMFLSGISMKLGAYGAFRVAICLLPEGAHQLAWIFLILSGFSVVYGAFAALGQSDLKYINAYASISHCGLMFFAFLIFNETALTGAFLQMISHGLITALFFACIGMIYSRTHTRLVSEMGGLMKVMPFIGVGFIIAGLASLGLPGFSGFVAEMTIFIGAFQNSGELQRWFTIFATASIVITAVYILRVVGKVLYGKQEHQAYDSLADAYWWERVTMITLIAAVVLVGTMPSWFSNMIQDGLAPLVAGLVK
ncbi:MAG: dehydrogenase subunit [Bacteroidetes bacterium]|nr:dehydrogenase subunit [Bacteroidota bacterium]